MGVTAATSLFMFALLICLLFFTVTLQACEAKRDDKQHKYLKTKLHSSF